MRKDPISFNRDQLNRLFPFYFIVDHNLKICSFGKSLGKLFQIREYDAFHDLFYLKRPDSAVNTYNELLSVSNQMVVLKSKKDGTIVLRGQLDIMDSEQKLIFLGSPWFGSMDQVRDKNLTIDDFAIHDSMIDLLHVLKTQEMAAEEMKELLQTVNLQKNKLKKDRENLKRLSLVASANENGVCFTDTNGSITWVNQGYCSITGFKERELIGKPFVDFLKHPGKNRRVEDISEKLREADIPKDKLTGPAMAISQLAWSEEQSNRDIVKGFMSTVVVFQEAIVWLADYQNFNDLTFGVIKEFNNIQTPETVAAIFLGHMIKEDPLYPPGIEVTIDD
ncbi:MAG: PAS domain-containing protein, partial [Cytophagales bacterium]|nr:PAS domain-containing protein [Cytophagales bacterium]